MDEEQGLEAGMVALACLEQTVIGLGSIAPAISDALPPPRESLTLLHAGSPLPVSKSLLRSAESWEGLTTVDFGLGRWVIASTGLRWTPKGQPTDQSHTSAEDGCVEATGSQLIHLQAGEPKTLT